MKIRLLIIFFGLFVQFRQAHFFTLMNHIDTPSIEHGRKLNISKTIDVSGLKTHKSQRLDQTFLQNKWTMLTFGFTSCPDVCPTAMAAFSDELNLLSETKTVCNLFCHSGPERDSKAKLQRIPGYFHKDIVGVTGSPERLTRFAKLFRRLFRKASSG